MSGLTNTIQNNALAALTRGASQHVLGAIKTASSNTGVDFSYLLQQAKAESSFNPSAQAKTSSATGLYQFINATWMDMIEKYGSKYGIETEGKSRSELLELRKDPVIASNMAAEFAGENERFLNSHWGGEVGSTELYFAHFLGAGGAASFLNARDSNGNQPAAVVFPQAAKANYNVFYERGTGRAKSLNEVYAYFDKKFDIEDVNPETFLADADIVSKPVESTDSSSNLGGLYAMHKPSSIFVNRSNDYNPMLPVASNSNNHSLLPTYQLVQSPLEIMMLSQLDTDLNGQGDTDEKRSSIF